MSDHFVYLVTSESAESGTLESLPPTDNLKIIPINSIDQKLPIVSGSTKIAITSESVLENVAERMDRIRAKAIRTLKDKVQFRKILKNQFPDFLFHQLSFEELANLKLDKRAVLKPGKGCFGTGVHTVDQHTNFKKLQIQISEEISKNAQVLSENVLSQNEFILEEYIEGEEFAVDLFFNQNGAPCITNIYHHPIPLNQNYLHMIYYTSRSVFDKIFDHAMDFLVELNKVLNVRNFPMHAEFRHDGDRLIPIEINALRFGGMGLGNMAYHTMGVNAYERFLKGESPNWDALWKLPEHRDSNYTYFIAYNGQNADLQHQKPNVSKLKKQFTTLMHESLFDYKKQLAFGTFILNEPLENIYKLLEIEFDEYFE
jgi:hypothetical protein